MPARPSLVTLSLTSAAVTFAAVSIRTHAAEIDLPKLLRERAAGSGPGQQIETINATCRKIPFTGDRNCRALSVQNIRATDAGVTYSAVKASPIPETITTESFLFRNCSSDERKDSKTVSISFTEGYSIVTLDSMSRTSGVSATLTIKGQQLGITDSRDVSFSETKSHDFSRTVNETVVLEESIKPYTALLVKIEKRISNAFLDFEGDVRANADLYSTPCCGWSGDTRLLGQFTELVGELPFKLRGQIWNAKSQSTVKSYSEMTLNKDNPVHCPPIGIANAQTPLAAKAPLSALNKQFDTSPSFARVGASNVQGEKLEQASAVKRTAPFINGMTITTANVVANVEVRAKSFGPGFCGVTFNTSGGTTQFLAPPLAWSQWTNLVAHISKASFTITNDVACDTGVVAEVRYFK